MSLPSYPLPAPKVRTLSFQALSEMVLQTATGRSLVPGFQGPMGRGVCKIGVQAYLSSSPGSATDQGLVHLLLRASASHLLNGHDICLRAAVGVSQRSPGPGS